LSSTIPGDPFGTQKEAKSNTAPDPSVVKRAHERADTDSSSQAIHHTLGIKNGQSSPGDHKHDGKSSKRLMDGITITGSRGGNAALADLITKLSVALGFTDSTS
jgi:chemotaxis response regulator CheB